MARLSRLLKCRKNSVNFGGSKSNGSDLNKGWYAPEFDPDSIRLVVFRDHCTRGRVPLFDSKAFPPQTKVKQGHENEAEVKVKSGQCNTPKPSGRPGSDLNMLEEMIFGSVAMAHQGCTLKVHQIRTPPQLMVTKVFPQLRPSRESAGESESYDSLSLQGESSDSYTTPKQIAADRERPNRSALAQSVPLDVPTMQSQPKDEDSGVSNSMSSSCTSLNTPLPSPSSNSSSLNSDSYKHRRFIRNLTTSLEMQFWKRFSEDSTAGGEIFHSSKKSAKLGIGILFTLHKGKSEQINEHFQNFFFSHITLIENHVDKLRTSIEKILLNRRWCSQMILKELEVLRSSVNDLYTTPRLSEPVWLNMMTLSTRRVPLCQQYLKELMHAVTKYDTKSNHFFLSKLITAVLTQHLAWVPTVAPAGATPSRTYLDKHSAKWLDALAKSHPYNPLWAQLGDIYGAVGFPLRLSRTVVVGKKIEIICKILYILSYFIRCSQVHENNELLADGVTLADYEYVKETDDDPGGGDPGHMTEMEPISEDLSGLTTSSDMQKTNSGELSFGYNTEGKIRLINDPCKGLQMLARDVNSPSTKNEASIESRTATPGDGTKTQDDLSELENTRSSHPDKSVDKCESNSEPYLKVRTSSSSQDYPEIDISTTDHVQARKCQLSPVQIREAQVLRINHVGRDVDYPLTSVDVLKSTEVNVNVHQKLCSKSPRKCSGSDDNTNDSGIFDGSSVDVEKGADIQVGNSIFYVSLNDRDKRNRSRNDSCSGEDEHTSTTTVISETNCAESLAMSDSESASVNAEVCTHADQNRDSSAQIQLAYCDENTAKKCINSLPSNSNDTALSNKESDIPYSRTNDFTRELVRRSLSGASSSSLFDEYFTDENHITKLCPNMNDSKQQPAMFLRMLSNESTSIFDEYFSSEKDISPFPSADEQTKEFSGICATSSQSDSANLMSDVLDSSNSSNVGDLVTGEMRQRCDSQGSTSKLHRVTLGKHASGLARQFSRQSSGGQTNATPARTRCVTPTELGRRRHQSSASTVSDLDAFDPFLNLTEVPLLKSEQEEDSFSVQTFERNFGYSLMASCTERYLSDFALQGTNDPNYLEKLQRDLSNTVQNSVLDESISESVCIVADTDKWSVQLVSAQYFCPEKFVHKDVAASPMISNMIESVHDLWRLKMSPEFCLMHLEDRLQEIYFSSKTVAEYLRNNKLNIQELSKALGYDENDIPLLLAVAGTHTTNLALGLV